MKLEKIWIIDINVGTLLTFLIGIVAGIILFGLLYTFAVVKNINKKAKIKLVQEEDIDQKEIIMLIEDGKKDFKNKDMRNELGFVKHLVTVCKELAIDVSKKFYPNSKRAFLELTIDETAILGHYIISRVQEILDIKIVKLFTGMTINNIVDIATIKNKTDKSKLFKAGKEATKIYSETMKFINVINPVYWFKRLFLKNATDIVLNQIGLAVIAIIGEETYKIYSKKLFVADNGMAEEEIDKIFKDLKETLGEEELNASKEKK